MLGAIADVVCRLKPGQVIEWQGRWVRVCALYEIEDWAYELTLAPPISLRENDSTPSYTGERWEGIPEYFDGTQYRVIASAALSVPRLPRAFARLRMRTEKPDTPPEHIAA
jgi:hypothetical protein